MDGFLTSFQVPIVIDSNLRLSGWEAEKDHF